MDGYQRSYSSLNWPPMLIKQKYLTLIVIIIITSIIIIIIIIIRGNTDDTADLDTHTHDTIRDAILNVRSKADVSQLIIYRTVR